MKRAASVADLRELRSELRGSVGFVPTMGALHDGHAALVRQARKKCASVVVSIFVNPTQFNDPDDLKQYPRDVEADARLLKEWGCDVLFTPQATEMYPASHETTIDIGPLGTVYEGAHRPGHFAGVCLVVLKLLNIVQPRRAYFGRKDAQQLAVIRQMVRDLDVPVRIKAVDTVRDPDGLALSSRNRRLSPSGRIHALGISAGLDRALHLWNEAERDPEILAKVARTGDIDYDYCACVDPVTFAEPLPSGAALIVAAANVEGVRLIDNVRLPI